MTIVVLLSACNKPDKYHFDTSRGAVETYRGFLIKMKATKTSNTKEFVVSLKEWKEVNDTVYKFLVGDSAFIKYHNEANDYLLIHDSIRKELLRLSETWRYGYDDVLSIKEMSSPSRSRPVHIKMTRNWPKPFMLPLPSSPPSTAPAPASVTRRPS